MVLTKSAEKVAQPELGQGHFLRSLVRKLCFAAFGITAFVNLADPLNMTNLVYGILVGLFFGFLCKVFLSGILGLFNRDLKTVHGKKAISYAVERGMMFMIPFAVMALLATFLLKWSLTGGFVSAALMTAGGSAAMEIAKLKEKPALKNTILTSGIAWLFSTSWLFSSGYLGKIPPYLDGGVRLLLSLSGNFLK